MPHGGFTTGAADATGGRVVVVACGGAGAAVAAGGGDPPAGGGVTTHEGLVHPRGHPATTCAPSASSALTASALSVPPSARLASISATTPRSGEQPCLFLSSS